jgi:hypothetical protein
MKPLCDLCVKAGKLNISTMAPVSRIDGNYKRIGDAYRCQIHSSREYHPDIGYQSFPVHPSEANHPPLNITCAADTLNMYIASASSNAVVILRCAICPREEQKSI